jgi:hypothetical protein
MVKLRLSGSRCCRGRGGVAGGMEEQCQPGIDACGHRRVGSSSRLTPAILRRLPQPALVVGACLLATPADAHGFGERYELPVPLSLYLWGAAAAVVLSFVVFGLFIRRSRIAPVGKHHDLLAGGLGRLIAHPAVLIALKAATLGLFCIVVLAGLIGAQNPYRNIAPTLVWIVWWVGFAYVQAFVGDLWSLINPWRTVYDAANWAYRRLGWGKDLTLGLPYPSWLGAWPACFLLLGFSWIELVYPNAADPRHIASFAIAYSILTWAGMVGFGRDLWLQSGEVFCRVFGTLARFAPTEAKDGRLILRRFGTGLIEAPPLSTSMVAFVLLLLATVLYDGLIGTGEWAMLEAGLRPLLPGDADAASMAVRTVGLIAIWPIFLGAYLTVSALMSRLGGGRPAAIEVARRFALTLVPIVIGYHVAHYLVYLLVQGQYIIPLLSDPFGLGWNLLGTAGYRIDIGLVGARFAWYAAVAAIVVGHVAAVYLAHLKAIGSYDIPRNALRSQVPLTALMVAYTVLGLSIAAQPIVESRTASAPSAVATETGETVSIPPDAVLPHPPDGNLAAPEKTAARVKLTYNVLGSAFHDGTRTTMADLLYAYAFAYRWGVRDADKNAHYDPFVDAATASLRRHLVAVRPRGVDAGSKSFLVGDVKFVREVLTFEVYLDIAPGDPEWNAVVAPPWSTLPWHILALMEEAVSRGWAAFSEAEARRRGVPWLDLVRSEALNAKLAELVSAFERQAFRPTVLQASVTEDEARQRWRALAQFYKASGHFLVTNGPYKLKSWTPESVTLEAFRDLTYPLGVGSFDAYAIPRRGFVTKTEWQDGRLTLSGDIEVVEKFQRSYRLTRTPMKDAPGPVLQRSAPECRYVVTDRDGRVALTGTVPLGPGATFEVDLKGRLPAAHYTFSALIAVNGNAVGAEIHRFAFVVPQVLK